MSLALPEVIRLLLPNGTVKPMLLEDYLRGVVAEALPAEAPLEAMKALAVAARTFAANTHRHLDRRADVCTTRHCQAWNPRANPRAARAVMETRGIVGTHHDAFIEAFHFEHCDGKTRDATGVLVNAPAYLKSVACPCGFASLKGHGIGMCRRGMVVMARFGESYDYILKHYYTGITLEQIGIDEATRVKIPLTPVKHPAPAERRPPIRPKPAPAATTPPASTTPAPAEKAAPAKPARKTPPPRRSPRPKIEQEKIAEPPMPAEAPHVIPTPSSEQPSARPEPLRTADKPGLEEADDFLSYLAVEDIAPQTTDAGQPTPEKPPAPARDDALAISSAQDESKFTQDKGSSFIPPPAAFAQTPPASMPEALSVPPPDSMPEALPTALELEFIASPMGAPEEVAADFVAPPATIIEPDLDTFLPPVEKFYAPLDAPPSMPEALPSFNAVTTEATPFAWVPPPPLFESESELQHPKVLTDYLPGPRVIAGNLPKPGMLITVRDALGNTIVTVSGVAKHYGAGGFEAPLTDDGAYHVTFDGVEMDIQVSSETVFIYYR
jgi:hypothetical protein